MVQNEIERRVPVLDETGKPGNFGWSRRPSFLYDPALIRSPRRSVCESDRYVFFSPTHLVILEILDNGYLGYTGMSVISLKDKKRSTQAFVVPFSLGSFDLGGDSDSGTLRVERKKSALTFSAMEGGARIIKADMPRFGRRRSLRGEVVFTPPAGSESLVTNMPWRRDKAAFRLSRRSPWYRAEGVIQFGAQELVFSGGNSWGIFDWNRGVRPGADVSFWASGCGLSGGAQAAFSIGYGSADSSLGTENAFFLDGRLHKLDQVTFHISPFNWLLPWRFTSSDGRLEMVFAPHQERSESHQMFFHYLKRRQVFGFFSGKVILDGGSEFEFRNIAGFAERKKTRF
ncbi:MAG: DUF2804 domain-containing protein [Treponema sp.]|jgi:hypothetical protein|nr:DUF2804 domain-containing protein [Treponema sp.]